MRTTLHFPFVSALACWIAASRRLCIFACVMLGLCATARAEEAPDAYKDVNLVVDVVHRANLATKVARMRPIGVVKG